MSRLIVNNKSSISDDEALALVIDCVRTGRISDNGNQYCYASRYTMGDTRVIMTTSRNKISDSFTIFNDRSGHLPD